MRQSIEIIQVPKSATREKRWKALNPVHEDYADAREETFKDADHLIKTGRLRNGRGIRGAKRRNTIQAISDFVDRE